MRPSPPPARPAPRRRWLRRRSAGRARGAARRWTAVSRRDRTPAPGRPPPTRDGSFAASAARVRLGRDLARGRGLLDHQILAVVLHDLLRLEDLVPGQDEEPLTVRAHRLVLLGRQLDDLVPPVPPPLAEDPRSPRRSLLDRLVDLPERGLVHGHPLLEELTHRAEDRTVGPAPSDAR